jgi:hypothetical protein
MGLFCETWLYRFSIRQNKTDARCYFFNLLLRDAPPLALAVSTHHEGLNQERHLSLG